MEKHRRTVVSRSPRVQLAIMAAAFTAAVALLACFPPERYTFYPSCPLHELLGLQCPGCGLTRALADLMAGRMREAAGHNALAVALMPAVVGFALMQSYSVLRWNRWREVRVGPGWVAVAYAAVAVFGLGRNLGHGFWIGR
ncbi:MAG TPA: hypothetical protein DEQ47_00200 [Solibacterales bacterium]|nr:hypothetical protein [Bryobacterales bacterium]